MNNTLEPLIVWEKWLDPFGKDLTDAKWTDYDNDLEFFNTGNEEEDDDVGIKVPNNPIKVIATPLGLIPYNEHTASSKIFNFWIGHTNFDISLNIKEIIETIKGVEVLDVFTRYRFRIAIAKCFDETKVKTDINNQLSQFINNYYGTQSQHTERP